MLDDMPQVGHNNPPDPIETHLEAYADLLSEVENWTDGNPVETEGQMNAVDGLLKQVKTMRADLVKAGKLITQPLHKQWKEKVAYVKRHTDDADAIQTALVAIVAPFKEKLTDEKEAERLAAWAEADAKRIYAERLELNADAANLDESREVIAAKQAAQDAKKAASIAQKDTVKGMRNVDRFEIVDMGKLVDWLTKNRRDDMAEWATDMARSNHKAMPQDVVRSWTEKEAF